MVSVWLGVCERLVYIQVNIILGLPGASKTTPAAILIVEEGVDLRLGTLDHLPKLPEGMGNNGAICTADCYRDRNRNVKKKTDRSTEETMYLSSSLRIII